MKPMTEDSFAIFCFALIALIWLLWAWYWRGDRTEVLKGIVGAVSCVIAAVITYFFEPLWPLFK